MITQPTCAQLILVVRKDLLEVVAPHVHDPTVAITVQMMAMVLASAASRASGDAAWMREETADITESAVRFAAAHPGSTDIEELLEAIQGAMGASADVEPGPAYQLASELLSRATEVAVQEGDAAFVRVFEDLLRARLARELAIIGGALATPGRD